MSDAVSAQGATIAVGDGASPEVFTEIGEVTDFTTPDGEAPDIDVTHLGSTAAEFLQGLPDNGSVPISGNFVGGDAAQSTLRTARAAQTLKTFKITLTDSPATVFTFSAFVKSFVVAAAQNDKLGFSANLRVSGAVTES